MKSILTAAIIILFLSTPLFSEYERCRLVRIVDGDTFIIQYNGKNEKLRLTGIDTPEASNNPKARRDSDRKNTSLEEILEKCKRSKYFAKALLAGEKYIYLEFDVQKRDRYRRILAYVYLSDGRMINELMLKAGYAALMTVPPNVKYKGRFLKAYREARVKKRGLWADCHRQAY
jgi:micrococcal nuclease